MKRQTVYRVLGLLVFLMGAGPLGAEEPSAHPGAGSLGPNTPDEPLRARYSPEAAARFLDAVALDWQRENKCFACHADYAYLLARPAVAWDVPAHRQIRSAAERTAKQDGLQAEEPGRSSESVLLAAALAINDAQTTRTLHPLTRRALDRMWTLQRDDGTWPWPTQCKWPPSEIDQFYGVAVAALAVGMAPGGYRHTPQAKQGLEKIHRFLGRSPPATTYQRAMLLWVSRYVGGVLSEAGKKAAVEELLSLQRPDGGWALASLGNWQRADGKPQDTQTSDGYGTGFVIYVLRMADLPAQHPQIQKGIDWLKTHQRASGRWYTRSPHKDSKHFITHEGTAFALMALAACDAIRHPPSGRTDRTTRPGPPASGHPATQVPRAGGKPDVAGGGPKAGWAKRETAASGLP
jgi:squalene-hopene/tetraprenyl-beta-curcumene cyclase